MTPPAASLPGRMQRTTLLWTLVVFFGASIAFRAVRNATEDEPVGVTLALEALVAVVLVLVIVAIVRRQRD